jgi:hypothetical protein
MKLGAVAAGAEEENGAAAGAARALMASPKTALALYQVRAEQMMSEAMEEIEETALPAAVAVAVVSYPLVAGGAAAVELALAFTVGMAVVPAARVATE